MADMRTAITPKSDQLNYEDFLGGKTITVKIAKVTIKSGEQPVTVNFEGDNGKPYKPCKTMCKAMVIVWGADANRYVGRSMALYGDPSITWGGMAVGGIRISHMSHIEAPVTMALASTRASKKLFIIKPLIVQSESQDATGETVNQPAVKLHDLLTECCNGDSEQMATLLNEMTAGKLELGKLHTYPEKWLDAAYQKLADKRQPEPGQ